MARYVGQGGMYGGGRSFVIVFRIGEGFVVGFCCASFLLCISPGLIAQHVDIEFLICEIAQLFPFGPGNCVLLRSANPTNRSVFFLVILTCVEISVFFPPTSSVVFPEAGYGLTRFKVHVGYPAGHNALNSFFERVNKLLDARIGPSGSQRRHVFSEPRQPTAKRPLFWPLPLQDVNNLSVHAVPASCGIGLDAIAQTLWQAKQILR